MKQIIYIIFLSLALVMGVSAQKSSFKPGKAIKIKPNSISLLRSRFQRSRQAATNDQLVFNFSGVQSGSASWDAMNNLYRENSFVLNGTLDEFGPHLTVSMDYTVDPMDPNVFHIANGKWAFVLYDSGVYTGTLYGDISSGDITLPSGPGSTREITAQFNCLGGTDEFSDIQPGDLTLPFSASTTDDPSAVPTTAALTFF